MEALIDRTILLVEQYQSKFMSFRYQTLLVIIKFEHIAFPWGIIMTKQLRFSFPNNKWLNWAFEKMVMISLFATLVLLYQCQRWQ